MNLYNFIGSLKIIKKKLFSIFYFYYFFKYIYIYKLNFIYPFKDEESILELALKIIIDQTTYNKNS